MTTFSYTITLDDGECFTLGTALALLKEDCLEQMATDVLTFDATEDLHAG